MYGLSDTPTFPKAHISVNELSNSCLVITAFISFHMSSLICLNVHIYVLKDTAIDHFTFDIDSVAHPHFICSVYVLQTHPHF